MYPDAPLSLPPREPPSRTSYDSAPPKPHAFVSKKTPGPRPLAVSYIEDDIRQHQFSRDHLFQSFHPRGVTEAGAIEDEHLVSGLQWMRLSQHGRNPSPEKLNTHTAVQSAPNLHQAHVLAVSDTFAAPVPHGAHFGLSVTTCGFEAETTVPEADERRSGRQDDFHMIVRKLRLQSATYGHAGRYGR
ncbi:hypothetical protein EDB92DRAFT_1941864 [Lactarius akahatsu]|uniref:Uncharacterized protein n=1 Tax=Lactarius akahatsu TaxID=416441 RepID=A0AAD4LR11_9AGAM|nr:hypothetical protein EDB92DRAFT_1941864 [Lactarius akahatsu]